MSHHTAPDFLLPDPRLQPEFYADVPSKRLMAWILDSLIIFVICFVGLVLTGFLGLFFLGFLWLAAGFIYRIATLASGSATWGMRMMAIEFRSATGARLDGTLATLHTLGYSVSFSFPLLQIVSIVMMLTDARGQGLTDRLLGTVAINRPAAY